MKLCNVKQIGIYKQVAFSKHMTNFFYQRILMSQSPSMDHWSGTTDVIVIRVVHCFVSSSHIKCGCTIACPVINRIGPVFNLIWPGFNWSNPFMIAFNKCVLYRHIVHSLTSTAHGKIFSKKSCQFILQNKAFLF